MAMIGEVARFAAEVRDLPDAVLERTKLILADCIGAIVDSAAEPEVAAFAARQPIGDALLIGTAQRVPPAQAALVNGTAGTWLEMDEGNLAHYFEKALDILMARDDTIFVTSSVMGDWFVKADGTNRADLAPYDAGPPA